MGTHQELTSQHLKIPHEDFLASEHWNHWHHDRWIPGGCQGPLLLDVNLLAGCLDVELSLREIFPPKKPLRLCTGKRRKQFSFESVIFLGFKTLHRDMWVLEAEKKYRPSQKDQQFPNRFSGAMLNFKGLYFWIFSRMIPHCKTVSKVYYIFDPVAHHWFANRRNQVRKTGRRVSRQTSHSFRETFMAPF